MYADHKVRQIPDIPSEKCYDSGLGPGGGGGSEKCYDSWVGWIRRLESNLKGSQKVKILFGGGRSNSFKFGTLHGIIYFIDILSLNQALNNANILIHQHPRL